MTAPCITFYPYPIKEGLDILHCFNEIQHIINIGHKETLRPKECIQSIPASPKCNIAIQSNPEEILQPREVSNKYPLASLLAKAIRVLSVIAFVIGIIIIFDNVRNVSMASYVISGAIASYLSSVMVNVLIDIEMNTRKQ